MSFMFHPYPYADPNAVNPIDADSGIKDSLVIGSLNCGKSLKKLLAGKKHIVAIDGYSGVQFDVIKRTFEQFLDAVWIDVSCVYRDDYHDLIAPSLPIDREMDPALLYGVRFTDGYEALQDNVKCDALRDLCRKESKTVIVYGRGCLSSLLRGVFDVKIWVDTTPRQTALNFKYGKVLNVNSTSAKPFGETMRRNYYVDFENALALRWDLIRRDAIDFYISADNPDNMQMIPYSELKKVFHLAGQKPLHCRPVYLEGVWGGFYFKNLRNLPKEMKNCAWVFDMIPMEVSLALIIEGRELEVPFFTYVQQQGENLLGAEAFARFGGYFPVRFNYDDTYHSNGNMSIQCHPDAEYVVNNHGELGRQDESYYVCVTGQQACTYLGFRDEDSCSAFFKAARQAEKTHELIDYQKYVNPVQSVPGCQVMIPAGTIHASGRNQVVLEIGSLTVGSYTYKLYDYQRIDPQSGLPRPIHLNAGEKVIHGERTADWVKKNIVDHGYVVRQGDTWMEKVVGEHDLLYFSLRNLIFEDEIEDDTKGTFHVLALVDGDRVRVQSLADPSKYFVANNLDILVVPASFGKYRIINEGIGVVTVHKTILKEN
ncbi:phosphomannose isomerase [Sphaerochaeta pleomorpha str. Grapes]|uniref:Phosphomannose isomerase n=1 Tax=Sphaerochaeta pleomorpha (strain ATCC BAA-1885 / DSM 22778 / Grapes) TaxID=158190 RepID=G8QTE3_SPHPG|nr:phosphomannose isomerase [Sphaerochaeta pleomorpha]AEV30184.1 phosphomannose isomerase [Sphaerochaeta pleomorpha str. Grapes]